MFGAGVSPDSSEKDRVANGSLVFSFSGEATKTKRGGAEAKAATISTSSPVVTRPHREAATGSVRTPTMSGIYHLLDDAMPRDPFPLSGGGGGHCNHHQPQIISSSSSSSSPSPHGELELAGGERRLLLEALVGEILRGRMGASGGGGHGVAVEWNGRRDLEEMVRWVRGLAADPVAPVPAEDAAAVEERELQVLVARRALYLRMEDVPNADELPSFSRKRKQRSHNMLSAGRKKIGSSKLPTRRSERIAKKMKLMTSLLLTQRKKIGTGDQFQADIPEWTGPPSEKDRLDYRDDVNITKMLGTQIWPPERYVLQTDEVTAGVGRPEFCNCSLPRSYYCIRYHICKARDQLRSELGPAFSLWGFDSMGEEVSKMWRRDEQMRFDALERLSPASEYKTFWGVASKYFASKSRVDLLRYYLNVFLLRRVANQSRLNPTEIDSDEDDVEEEDEEYHDEEDKSEASGPSQRSQKAKKNS